MAAATTQLETETRETAEPDSSDWDSLKEASKASPDGDLISSVSDLDPELLRAVSSRTLLARWGKLVHVQDGEDTFLLSQRVEMIEVFLSHSWRTPAPLKLIALMFELNGGRAVLTCILLHFTAHAFEYAGLWSYPIPATMPFCLPDSKDMHCANCKLFLIIPCTALFVGLRFGQSFVVPGDCHWLRHRTFFLDRCCIHQTDEGLKNKGIKNLRTFLAKSSKLMMLWDPKYFTRLWCVYELAAFIRLNGGSARNVKIRPLKLWLFTLVYCAFQIAVATASIIMLPLTVASEWHTGWLIETVPRGWQYLYLTATFFVAFFCIYMVPAIWLWKFCKAHMTDRVTLMHQVKNFTVAEAECMKQDDRVFIITSIQEWYGDVSSFETYVRTHIADKVEAMLGHQTVPYRMVFVGAIGHLLMCISYAFAYLQAEEQSMSAFWHIVMAAAMLCFCADAIAVDLVLRLAGTTFGDDAEVNSRWQRKGAGPVSTALIFGAAKAVCGGVITPACPKWWCAILLPTSALCTWCIYYRRVGRAWAIATGRRRLSAGSIEVPTVNWGSQQKLGKPTDDVRPPTSSVH